VKQGRYERHGEGRMHAGGVQRKKKKARAGSDAYKVENVSAIVSRRKAVKPKKTETEGIWKTEEP